jgi:hypothetical protein
MVCMGLTNSALVLGQPLDRCALSVHSNILSDDFRGIPMCLEWLMSPESNSSKQALEDEYSTLHKVFEFNLIV